MSKRWLALLLVTAACSAGAAPDIVFEADITPTQVLVQQQAVYRLRLLHATDVDDIVLHGPSARLADFRAIGAERVYETRRDGKRYRVHERSYAVFPFAAGGLDLFGAYASASVPAPLTKSSTQRQPLRLAAPLRHLSVAPVPPQADGAAWLPAHALTLTESWSADAGLAQRRTIRIEASGIDAVYLPELKFATAGITVQAQAPRLDNRMDGEQNIAIREQSFIVTPARGGAFTVPALQLHWWNVDTDAALLATLPARTMGEIRPAEPVGGSVTSSARLALSAGALILGALLMAAYRKRIRLRASWRLRKACRAGDVRGLRDALLAWRATLRQPAPPTLGALASELRDGAASQALRAIDRQLYGPSDTASSAVALVAAVRNIKRAVRQESTRRHNPLL